MDKANAEFSATAPISPQTGAQIEQPATKDPSREQAAAGPAPLSDVDVILCKSKESTRALGEESKLRSRRIAGKGLSPAWFALPQLLCSLPLTLVPSPSPTPLALSPQVMGLPYVPFRIFFVEGAVHAIGDEEDDPSYVEWPAGSRGGDLGLIRPMTKLDLMPM